MIEKNTNETRHNRWGMRIKRPVFCKRKEEGRGTVQYGESHYILCNPKAQGHKYLRSLGMAISLLDHIRRRVTVFSARSNLRDIKNWCGKKKKKSPPSFLSHL